MNEIGKLLLVAGLLLAALGAVLWAGGGRWIGRLPGDIWVTRGNATFGFPIVTCLLISAVLSLLLWLIRR